MNVPGPRNARARRTRGRKTWGGSYSGCPLGGRSVVSTPAYSVPSGICEPGAIPAHACGSTAQTALPWPSMGLHPHTLLSASTICRPRPLSRIQSGWRGVGRVIAGVDDGQHDLTRPAQQAQPHHRAARRRGRPRGAGFLGGEGVPAIGAGVPGVGLVTGPGGPGPGARVTVDATPIRGASMPATAGGIGCPVLDRVDDKLADDRFCFVREPGETPRHKDFAGEVPGGAGRLRLGGQDT